MKENKTTTEIGKKYPEQKLIARSCTVSRSAEYLNFILVETEFGEWVVQFVYHDEDAELTSSIVAGDRDTLPAKHFKALRRRAIREMKRAEPSLGTKIAQWINE